MIQKRIISKDELTKLSNQIAEIEKGTSAEIRVVVRHRKHWSERKLSPRQLAEREFVSLGMSNTESRTGILVYILVSERKFELLADSGIAAVLSNEFWNSTAQKLSGHFTKNNFYHGLTTSLTEIGALLKQKLPPAAVKRNELPNDIIEE